jgi:hypothetical protein
MTKNSRPPIRGRQAISRTFCSIFPLAHPRFGHPWDCSIPSAVVGLNSHRPFGKLVKQKRKARTGFNPKTQQKTRIPAKTVLKFRVAKVAKDPELRNVGEGRGGLHPHAGLVGGLRGCGVQV